MTYYNSFCVLCSVRLGSIVVGTTSFVRHFRLNFISSFWIPLEKRWIDHLKKIFVLLHRNFLCCSKLWSKWNVVHHFQLEMLVPTLIMLVMGSNYFGDSIKNIQEYIKENTADDRFLSNLKHIEESLWLFFSLSKIHGFWLILGIYWVFIDFTHFILICLHQNILPRCFHFIHFFLFFFFHFF